MNESFINFNVRYNLRILIWFRENQNPKSWLVRGEAGNGGGSFASVNTIDADNTEGAYR